MNLNDLTERMSNLGAGRGKAVQEKTQQELRAAGKNGLHVTTRLFLEGWALQRECRRMMYFAEPIYEGYQEMRSSSKSNDSMVDYYRMMCSAKGLDAVRKIFGRLRNGSTAQNLGLVPEMSDLPLSVSTAGSSAVTLLAEEGEWTEKIVMTACNYAGHRLKSLLWHVAGLPGLLPGLLEHDCEESRILKQRLKAMDAAYTKAVEIGESIPSVAEQLSHTFLLDPIPKQVMDALRASNWSTIPSSIKAAIVSLFSQGPDVC